jgi:hypothetical protein
MLDKNHIRPGDLRAAFSRLFGCQNLYAGHSFCFFIDGLDEFQQTPREDYTDLVSILHSWTTAAPENVKLCVSSNMENVFLGAYAHANRLHLQDLTRRDMETYARDRLSYFLVGPGREQLVQVVVKRSRGLFRRVAVAVMSLRRLQGNGCATYDLEQELNSLPNGIGADDQEADNEQNIPARGAKVPPNVASLIRPQAGSPSAVWRRALPSSPGSSTFDCEPGDVDQSLDGTFVMGKQLL